MRLTAIEIHNFRQYQHLEFTFPKASSHDLHIIVADNGVGKTNILNAITWCLYDEEPHLGNASKSLPRLNLNAKAEALACGESKAEISVKLHTEDNGTTITFVRQTSVVLSSDFENKSTFSCFVNEGSGDSVLTEEQAVLFVEKYMPKRIREYFYFDGEQLDNYFITDDSTRIRETIHSISQVDVVTRVKGRLQEMISAYRSDAGKKAPNVKKINSEIADIEVEIHNRETEIATLKEQINTSKAIIQTNSERLSGQENVPELEAKYESMQEKKARLENELNTTLAKLYQFITSSKVALSIYPSARAALALIAEKEASHSLPPDIDKTYLLRLLEKPDGKCPICGETLTENTRSHIQELVEQIQVSSETSNILMRIRSELERLTSAALNYPKTKAALLKEYQQVQSELSGCEDELQRIDAELRRFEDKEQIVKWHTERALHEEILKKNQSKLAVSEYQLSQAETKLAETHARLSKEISKQKECAKLEALINFASGAAEVAKSIETEMMQEVRLKMESRTMDYFRELMWKQGVYDHIVLSETYQLDLIHRDGYPCVGSCSAAERSLLALAFTLALHEVSGFNSLLFIDTPVARVSGENRHNFASVLKEVSKDKQLILAFTPDEYSESIQKIFSGIASTSVYLKMNSSNDITSFS